MWARCPHPKQSPVKREQKISRNANLVTLLNEPVDLPFNFPPLIVDIQVELIHSLGLIQGVVLRAVLPSREPLNWVVVLVQEVSEAEKGVDIGIWPLTGCGVRLF